VDDLEQVMPADEGDGTASVKLAKPTAAVLEKLALRTQSNPSLDPETGADLGAGEGAGKITGEDLGGAEDIRDAVAQAKAK
jgi:Mn-containing catalase